MTIQMVIEPYITELFEKYGEIVYTDHVLTESEYLEYVSKIKKKLEQWGNKQKP